MDILANVTAAMLDLTRQEEEGSQNGAIHHQAEQISKSDLHHDDSGKRETLHMEREYQELKGLVPRTASSRTRSGMGLVPQG